MVFQLSDWAPPWWQKTQFLTVLGGAKATVLKSFVALHLYTQGFVFCTSVGCWPRWIWCTSLRKSMAFAVLLAVGFCTQPGVWQVRQRPTVRRVPCAVRCL